MATPALLSLDHSALETIFSAYQIRRPKGLLLFGFRGLSPLPLPDGWVTQSQLKQTPVDYEHLKCTLGLWDPDRQKIFSALASTVPHHEQVEKAAARLGKLKGRGTNQLEPGFYTDLTKGEHLQGKPKGHEALRQTAYRFYRRSHHAAPYRVSDPLYFGNPYDNLHCAWNFDGAEPGYSSAGCMVVAGIPHCKRLPDSGPNEGAWKSFHTLMYSNAQKTFPLLLVSGQEVVNILSEKHPKPRLIFGSRGEAVVALQKELAKRKKWQGKPTGYLGSTTYRAWNATGLEGYGDVLGV